MTLDLDKIAALVAEVPPGEWVETLDSQKYTVRCIARRLDGVDRPPFAYRTEAAAIVALVNAAPAILRLARLGAAYLVWAEAIDNSSRDDAWENLAAAYQAAKEAT